MKAHVTEIAATGERFTDFAPYVASIDDRGVVHFQATLGDGSTGLYSGDGDALETEATLGGRVRSFDSHPDVDAHARVAVYATLDDGSTALVVCEEGELRVVAGAADGLWRIGPLGPTVNDDGVIAFRADADGVFSAREGVLRAVAGGPRFSAFHGLRAIDARGRVAVRATAHDGRDLIVRVGDGGTEEVASTGPRFTALGLFPSIDDAGAVAFSATLATGRPCVCLASPGSEPREIGIGARFESVRGALVGPAGHLFFFASPRGGALGVYAADAPDEPRVAVGEAFGDSTITELALNPVSIDCRGRLAVRLRLADGRGVIVRVEAAP